MAICKNKKCSIGECDQTEDCAAYVPVISNADRIRAMGDEELAELLDKCENIGYYDSTIAKDKFDRSMDMLEWLKQPVEE